MECETFRHAGRAFAYRVESDSDMGEPWAEHDGHGPVSDWRRAGYTGRPSKEPGELTLCEDGGSARFYDFAEACRMARRDGWGFLPSPLRTARVDGKWQAWIDGPTRVTRGRNVGGRYVPGRTFRGRRFLATSPDINAAIRAVYAAHAATFPSPRAYAAAAARADFERLAAFCRGAWEWVGIVVAPVGEYGPEWDSAVSLWGVESDSPDYHADVARELAGEIE